MTDVLEIITQAYRESNLISINATVTPAQESEGFARLKALIASAYGYDLGEDLTDLSVGYIGQEEPDYDGYPYRSSAERWTHPEVNTRLVLNHDSTQRIYLPRVPRQGSRMQVVDVYNALEDHPITLDANGYLIEGSDTLVLDVAGSNLTWMFDDSRSEWLPVVAVEATDEIMPFGLEFEDYFITKLASRLNPRYGRSLSQETIARLQDQQEQMAARYRQSRSKPVADRLAWGLTTPNRRFRRLAR